MGIESVGDCGWLPVVRSWDGTVRLPGCAASRGRRVRLPEEGQSIKRAGVPPRGKGIQVNRPEIGPGMAQEALNSFRWWERGRKSLPHTLRR